MIRKLLLAGALVLLSLPAPAAHALPPSRSRGEAGAHDAGSDREFRRF